MQHKIKSIIKKVSQNAVLPDGYYNGTWGGRIITVNYKGEVFELTSKEGIRGINTAVVIKVENNIATFETINN